MIERIRTESDIKGQLSIFSEITFGGFSKLKRKLFKLIDTLSENIGAKGIWAIDREGDRGKPLPS